MRVHTQSGNTRYWADMPKPHFQLTSGRPFWRVELQYHGNIVWGIHSKQEDRINHLYWRENSFFLATDWKWLCFLLEKPCIQRLWSVNQSDVSVQSRGGVQGHLRGGRDWPLPWFTRTAICRCSVTMKAAALREQGHLWGVVAHRHSKNVLAHWKFSLTCGNFECWCDYLYHGLYCISVPLFKASQRQQWFSGITVAWQGGSPGSFVHGPSIVSNMESWSLCSLRIWST